MLTKIEKLTLRNRENALHSTGPKTPDGKARSSMNAIKHGLAGHTILMPSEHVADLQKFQKQYFEELRPKGVLERQLTQSLTDIAWALNRASAVENNIFAMGQMNNAPLIETDDAVSSPLWPPQKWHQSRSTTSKSSAATNSASSECTAKLWISSSSSRPTAMKRRSTSA